MPQYNAANIAYDQFKDRILQYEKYAPSNIQELDLLRYHDVPEVLEQRRKDGASFLEKTELTGLVEWKLKHGTYRPNLAKLVASNSVQDIRKATENAFAIYESNKADYVKSITALNKLKGIGPATASLVLACYDPINVPFFSDELFRYFHWSDGKLKGWDRKINYTMKEYKDMYEKVQTLRRRLEKASEQIIKAVDIEKMAYSMGKAQLEIGASTSNEDKALLPPPPKRRKREVPEPSNDPVSV